MKTPAGTHKRSGIYKIKCVETTKCYVGSAIDISARIRTHRFDLLSNRHHNKYLQRAWNKYGGDMFDVEVVEFCEVSNLISREQFYIDSFECVQPIGFNLNPKAGSSLGLKRSKKNCENMSLCRLGKSISEETKAKISAKLKEICVGKKIPRSMIEKAALINRGKPLSEEHRLKIGEAHRGKPRPSGMMKKLADFNRGKKRLPETVEKMRIAAKLQWETKNKNNKINE